MHITASVFINDDESGLTDYRRWLTGSGALMPARSGTITTGREDNADARRNARSGREVVVAVTEKARFRPWGRSSTANRRPKGQAGAREDHRRIGGRAMPVDLQDRYGEGNHPTQCVGR
jgi:hypothetical protein